MLTVSQKEKEKCRDLLALAVWLFSGLWLKNVLKQANNAVQDAVVMVLRPQPR